MGELSKKIGEAGEDLVATFFKLIGWSNAQKGLDLQCVKPERHTAPGSRPRQSHGVDFLFSYASPLTDGVFNNLIISVKFSNDDYPSSPGALFKDHFKHLVQSIECFKKSQDKQLLLSGKQGIKKVQDVGVLFWISNSDITYDDLIGKLAKTVIPDTDPYETVYLVDNRRMTFVYQAFTYAKREYPESEVEFYFFETGKNTNPLIRHHTGSILPVEYVNTSVLPLKAQLKGSESKVLMLFSIDPFSEANLRRLIGMTKNLSGGWASKIELCFPDYKQIEHENIVQRIKMSFEDKKTTDNLVVFCYTSDFRNMRNK